MKRQKNDKCTYIFFVVKSVENIVRQAGKQVNNKPGPQIVHSDSLNWYVYYDLSASLNDMSIGK